MSNVAVLNPPRAAASLGQDYLGPAHVVEGHGRAFTVELPDGAVVHATLALAFSYEPVPGDILLVIGKAGAWYGIGVLHGTGKTSMEFHGDVDLRAVGGTVSITGDKGVEIRGPELDIQTGKLRMMADSVVQKFASVYQRVSSLLSVHAKETHTVVEETAYTQSKSGVMLTEETMTINGKQIHLG
jgi:hypothetical protein